MRSDATASTSRPLGDRPEGLCHQRGWRNLLQVRCPALPLRFPASPSRWRRGLALPLLLFASATPALAQRIRLDEPPRRQFVTISIDVQQHQPLHFKQYPLEQLVGQPLSEVQDPLDPINYRASDGTSVDVLEYRKRTKAIGITVYPFGAGNGAALALRATRETLPVIRFDIARGGVFERYQLADGVATDFGIGVIVNDRPRGWGLGAHSFVIGGYGLVSGERGDGKRYFAEAGGGVSVGPVGVDVGVKVAYNRLEDPRPHTFYTVPISVKGTVSF